jgi:hypothetical protein
MTSSKFSTPSATIHAHVACEIDKRLDDGRRIAISADGIDEHLVNEYPVKEIAVIGPDGKTLCNHLGLPSGDREVVSSEPLVGADGYRLHIVTLAGGERGPERSADDDRK